MAENQEPLLDAADAKTLNKLRSENRWLKVFLACFAVGGAVLGMLSLSRLGQHEGTEQVPVVTTSVLVHNRSHVFLPTTSAAPPVPVTKRPEVVVHKSAEIEVPEFFDSREEWPGCGAFVVDQGQCGDCWAASGANVLGDRACIHLLQDGSPVPGPHAGAHGIGAGERMFQQAGKCVGTGSMNMLHPHGCKRSAMFASPQALVSCANLNSTAAPTHHPYPADSGYKPGHNLYPSSSGCNGGEAQDAWRYFYHEGLTIMDSTQQGGCTPYTSGLCAAKDPMNNGCHVCNFDQCADTGEKPERVRVDSFGWIMEEGLPERGHWKHDESFEQKGSNLPRPRHQWPAMERQVRKIQIEMMTNGPVHTCIDVYTNFPTFWNDVPQGIYNSTEDSPMEGGHCIELMGWGTDSATHMPYWIWKNSWGTNFANGGFGRILRGVDLLGIESDVWAGCPTGSNCELTEGVVHNETWVPNHAYEPTHRSGSSSAAAPSRSWPGGREHEMTRKDFSHHSIAPIVVAAVRQALDDPDMDRAAALAAARRVWTRSVRGTRVRVEVEGVGEHVSATRHMEGHLTVG